MTKLAHLALCCSLISCTTDPRTLEPENHAWHPITSSLKELPSQAEPLEFMVAPWISSSRLTKLYEPLLRNLSSALQKPVRLNIAPDYPSLLRLIREGKIDIAQVNGRTLQSLLESPDIHQYIGTVLHHSDTKGLITDSKGLLITRPSTQFSLKSVPNLRLGLVDTKSTSGYLLPKLYFHQRGIPLEQFQDVLLLGSHTKSFIALRENRVDLIGSWDGQLELEEDHIIDAIKVVAETGILPNDAWVSAGPDLEALAPQLRKWAQSLPSHLQEPELYPESGAFVGLKAIDLGIYRNLPQNIE